MPKAPTPTKALCPYCRVMRPVMPSGLLDLHTIQGKWGRSMCKGSGAPSPKKP